MMFLAKELGKSLEEIMELTVMEYRLWAAFYSNQHKEQEKVMRDGNKYNRKTYR